ncbi:hypothetical protein L6452_37777 [Arctium lappa]|uniref:Uncharacterized protein n=1 Tax=Arctium lappa TaxID=4217 RepID=A0ACB8Y354_ARCLA|nr:hypothetical protein L6452_37777 [Arctium lappa]
MKGPINTHTHTQSVNTHRRYFHVRGESLLTGHSFFLFLSGDTDPTPGAFAGIIPPENIKQRHHHRVHRSKLSRKW